jgi:voltage-gated potassium channel
MQRKRVLWTVVLRLAVVVTAISTLVVVLGATGIWLIEGHRPDATFRSWGDALWWSLATLTTVGYGDHVPVTTAGRLVAAVVMVVGVAVIGAVAAMVALAVTLRVAQEEERVLEAEAESLEQRLERRLDRIEAQLTRMDDHLRSVSPPATNSGLVPDQPDPGPRLAPGEPGDRRP